jgi:hypothetical protein
VLVILWTTSCSDYFLKEEPKGQILNDSAFSDHSDLEGAVHTLNRQVLMGCKGQISFEPTAQGDDEATHPSSNKAYIREWDNFDVSDENGDMILDTGSWYWLWKIIKASNYILNGVDKTPQATEAELTFAKGQAYYWRAWAYFYLTRIWGPVPLVTTGDVDLSIGVTTVEELLEFVVSDLKEAEKLPASYSNPPWAMNGVNVVVSKGAAQASLSYVYLYMAGWPLNRGTEYYNLAAEKALEVITASDNGTYYYRLYDDYQKIHSKAENLQNKEVILAVYYSSITGTGDNSQSGRGAINDIHEVSGGYNDRRAEIGFYCDFPEGPRKDWTYAPVTYSKDKGQAFPWWSEEIPVNERQPYFRKSAFTSFDNQYANEEYDHWKSFQDQSNGWSTQIHQVIRLAEVYCFYAEAVGRSGQTNAKAISVLNKVRNRANGNGPVDDPAVNYYPSSISPSELAEAGYNEHGWEVAGAYNASIAARYYDMQRMDRVKAHFDYRKLNPEREIPGSGGVKMRELYGPPGAAWDQKLMYGPYPAPDVRMNPSLKDIDKLNMIFKK